METIRALKKRFIVLVSDAKLLKKDMDELREWNTVGKIMNNLGSMYDFVQRAVIVMEATAKDLVTFQGEIQGSDKRKALVEALDAMIVLPPYLEPFDGFAIQLAVDFAVRGLNERLGHDWGLGNLDDLMSRGRDIVDLSDPFPWEKRSAK